MAWTQTDRDKLAAAIAAHGRGELVETLEFAESSYNFAAATLDERLKLLALMDQELAAAAGTRRSYRVAAISKGF